MIICRLRIITDFVKFPGLVGVVPAIGESRAAIVILSDRSTNILDILPLFHDKPIETTFFKRAGVG